LSSGRNGKPIINNSGFHEIIGQLKGRTFLYIAGIILLTLLLGLLLHGGCESWRESNIERKNHALTSAVAKNADMFAYDISTSVGRTLAYGKVTVDKSQCVSISGSQGCYAYINETREEYTEHTRTYDCGTTKNPRTCTENYYTWDYAGNNSAQASWVKLLGKQVPYDLVSIGSHSISARDLGIGSGLYRYSSPWTRYSYDVVDSSYTGTAWLNLQESGMSALESFKADTTPEQFQAEVSKLSPWPSIVFWFVLVLMIAGAITGAGALVMNDYNDGEDNDF
jgi:hypothetical protein